jgi:hypothetical protein
MNLSSLRSVAVLFGLFVAACNGAAVSPDPYDGAEDDDAKEQPVTTKPKTKPKTTPTATPTTTATPAPTTTTTPTPAPTTTATPAPDPTQPPAGDATCKAKPSQDECAACCDQAYPEGQGVDDQFNNCLATACGIQDDGQGGQGGQ